ncbi:MAG TPA: hypothetical protein VEB66_14905 [Opitutaceae bacterium]|nr:hypothetical protein [Opitutaceae bacterium]
MKTVPAPSSARRGSALITVVFLTAVMAILTASMLSYTLTERRGNERNRLILRAKNMSENISVYAAEQLTTKLMRLRSATPMAFIGGDNEIDLPPDFVLDSEFTRHDVGMEVRAGLTTSTGLQYVDPALPANASNPNAGLSVSTSTVPIISKATATHPSLGAVTAYMQHDMEVAMIPLFQFGIFFNMDLEFFPGQDMTILGPVHTNGRLMARGESPGAASVTFTQRVTAAQGLYANGLMKVSYRNRSGTENTGAGGSGPVNYTNLAGTAINLYGTHNGSSKWRDHKMGLSNETATTLTQFKTNASTTWGGNVRTNVHGVTALELPSVGSYKETNDPATPEDDRNNGRQLIAPPNHWVWDPADNAWEATTDSAAIKEVKISRRAGLYIVANPDDEIRIGKKPDGSNITMLPYSYRAFLNTVNNDGSHTITEVVLPGQPSYGYNDNGTPADATDDWMYVNNLPNRYTSATSIGANQILRLPRQNYTHVRRYNGTAWVAVDAATLPDAAGYGTGVPVMTGTIQDAYFYDLRRAHRNHGYPYNRSAATPYTPRPITKIDFDVARFEFTVNRTMAANPGSLHASASSTTGYNPDVPTATNWANSIFNPSGTVASHAHGTGASFATYPAATDAATRTRPDPFRMFFAPANPTDAATIALLADDPGRLGVGSTSLLDTSNPCPWFDGITIYIHSVEAERRAHAGGVPQRADSGVRLWNGRGPVVSLSSTGKTGFTFVTNDAAYIVGHFNADGTINSSTGSTTNPGGYSGRFPESSAERLACVMADAITILSQPTFTNSGGYYQIRGWNDALSGNTVDTGSYSAAWNTSNPSSSNNYEGVNTSRRPAAMPNLSTPGALGTAVAEKLPTISTEVSACLLMGLVPSNHNPTGLSDGAPSAGANQQYSGGAHNFPRLSEGWHNNGVSSGLAAGVQSLVIRGSMVALFESRVAMEPWNIRTYQAPERYWGLHQSLADPAHDVPLEPIVLNARRMRFRELSSNDYATLKTTIEALPH